MSELPENLKYATSHEWVSLEQDGVVRVGITDFAQTQLGDIMHVDFPKVGQNLEAGQPCAVVESVKSASDLYSPVSGEVVAINEMVVDAPELVNDAPYQAWLFCIKASDLSTLDSLLDANAYQDFIDQ